MKNLLIGLVNHVMLPVVNVTDLLTDNVMLVVLKLLILSYMKDIVEFA